MIVCYLCTYIINNGAYWHRWFPNFPRSIYLRNLQWIRQIAGHVNLLIYEDNVQGISCYSGQYCCVITACWVSCFVVCGCDSWCILVRVTSNRLISNLKHTWYSLHIPIQFKDRIRHRFPSISAPLDLRIGPHHPSAFRLSPSSLPIVALSNALVHDWIMNKGIGIGT